MEFRKDKMLSAAVQLKLSTELALLLIEIIWLHSVCKEFGLSFTQPSCMWCDDKSAISLASYQVFHSRTKHVEVDVHFIRAKIHNGVIVVGYVPSDDQEADLLTKLLSAPQFAALQPRLPLAG